ncbi:type I secretion protein ATPase [Roseovarius sp. SCSIO 43702]|uniref:type I secretion protein ATPase n=1 Tax=Roseovarius sp. SCSIO 43702 TaxID=2823043 RepID=UPI001C72CD07|nr:type I secretion protein ATPase [Roseovarius sp. SCSIO 43702]QYX57197.1 type I secretion protein ATPase [Roseovarius sp. SCSIO 43702]
MDANTLVTRILTLDPASSVYVVTVQVAYLYDDDFLSMTGSAITFEDPDTFLADLRNAEVVATAINAPLASDPVTPGEDASDQSVALYHHVGAIEDVPLTHLVQTVARGEDAHGLHENGAQVEEHSLLDDVMPGYLQLKAGKEQTEDDAMDPPGDPFRDLEDDDPAPYTHGLDDGHVIIAGGNTLINQTAIITSWLDAPVISVMGDAIKLDVISQVNVMSEQNATAIVMPLASAAISGAFLEFAATAAPADPGAEDADVPLGLPSNWVVTRVNGDLVSYNYVNQYSFQTDHDRAEIGFGQSKTFISLGDNTIVNLAALTEIGFGYDLIMVGGAMISINWISQTNILVDHDSISYTGDFPTGIELGDNLLFNAANIFQVGVDSYAEMQDNFADASDTLADGGTTLSANVAHDGLFEGTDLLRVLYIEGDLTQINWIEQTNVLGDSDQVHLALENFEDATGATLEVIGGANALINLASITQYGTDSTVLVDGDVYDDALLYQAELIDTDASPTGVSLPALASEAVLFLAEDMLTPDCNELDTPIGPTAPEDTSSPDVMQTMLA